MKIEFEKAAETSRASAPTAFLTRLVPHSLLWQTFLLIALLLIFSLSAWSQIMRHFQEPSRASDLSQMVISVVNLTRTALINAESSRRADLLIDLVALEGIRIYPAEPADPIQPLPDTRLMRLLTEEIRAQLGDYTRIAARWKSLDGFWVSFRLDRDDDNEFWVMMPTERFNERPGAAVVLYWTGGALLAALFGAFFIVSWFGKPLRQLANAARVLGEGGKPPRVSEDGAAEIAAVARAFNTMSDDLARTDADRTLLLAGVSHDLRTPLARLRLGVELSGARDSDVVAMVTDIEEMDRIIGQFLDFGRNAAAEPAREVELCAFVADLVESFKLRGAPLHYACPAHQVMLALHPLPMRRAVANLIDNAWRHAGASAPIDVRIGEDLESVSIEVLDRGPGIPAEEVAHLRQPFTRRDIARSGAHGAGLGLAIIDRIMEAHRGRLELVGRDGGGLLARIIIPKVDSEQARAKITDSSKALP